MPRPSPWLLLVVLLLGLLILREPRFERWDETFPRWLLANAEAHGPPVPLTVVEIGRDPLLEKRGEPNESAAAAAPADGTAISPLEFALFLQAVLEFQPEVIAFETVLRWRERDKAQEQVFLDQAMRVPKLLLAAELTGTPDPDAASADVRVFTQVKGKRGDLVEFSGIGRQPGEDLRLVSTLGFVDLPAEVASDLRVPLLFLYRGEVIPSFVLQAILLWLRVTPPEVKIEIGSEIVFPDGRKIPIRADGTLFVNPKAATKARRLSLNELLLASQQRASGTPTTPPLAELRQEIVLARTPANPLAPPDIFAAAIATIQGNTYLRRAPQLFDCVVLLLVASCAGIARKIERVDLVLWGIAVTAAYCLIALALVSHWHIWLPGCLPLGALWLMIFASLVFRKKTERQTPTHPASSSVETAA